MTVLKVSSFVPPGSAVTVNPGRGLSWTLVNAAISISGSWRYKYRAGIITLSDHGSFDASASGVSVSASVTLGASATGEPTIAATGCNCRVGSLRIRTHGGASWLYNLFIDKVERPLRATMQLKICDAAASAINVEAVRELATLKVKVVIGGQWLIDYRLVAAPAFAAGYMESFHKGEFFQASDPTEAPFQPIPLPNPASTDHMVTFWASEYVLNTAGFALYRHGVLGGIFTRKDLPAEYRDYLNTTCPPLLCIGSIVPTIGRTFPNATVELEVTTQAAPTVSIDRQRIVGKFLELVILRARLENGSLIHLFNLNVTASLSITPRLNGTTVSATVSSMEAALNVTESSVGPVDIKFLRFLVDIARQKYIMPQLNEILGRGFPLPSIKHVEYVGAGLQLLDGCIIVATDIRYRQDNSFKFFKQLYM